MAAAAVDKKDEKSERKLPLIFGVKPIRSAYRLNEAPKEDTAKTSEAFTTIAVEFAKKNKYVLPLSWKIYQASLKQSKEAELVWVGSDKKDRYTAFSRRLSPGVRAGALPVTKGDAAELSKHYFVATEAGKEWFAKADRAFSGKPKPAVSTGSASASSSSSFSQQTTTVAQTATIEQKSTAAIPKVVLVDRGTNFRSSATRTNGPGAVFAVATSYFDARAALLYKRDAIAKRNIDDDSERNKVYKVRAFSPNSTKRKPILNTYYVFENPKTAAYVMRKLQTNDPLYHTEFLVLNAK